MNWNISPLVAHGHAPDFRNIFLGNDKEIAFDTIKLIAEICRAVKLNATSDCPTGRLLELLDYRLPRGAVIATADLVECWSCIGPDRRGDMMLGVRLDTPQYDNRYISDTEMLFGDFAKGRYAWELANVEILPQPVPVRGKQGLWNLETTSVDEVTAPRLLNAHGEYVFKFARNHGLSIDDAHNHPMVKAHQHVFETCPELLR